MGEDTQTALAVNPPYDIVVVGGGITGAGIARDAALRGLRVALFEKDDYATGTSSKSSKLIHGGLRYLEQGEIGLVFESVSERRVQSRMAPHLVRPMPFLVPIYEAMKPGLEIMNIGLWIYDTLAMFRAPKMHKTYRGDSARELEPNLRHEDMKGAIEYYDCVTDDARLVLENIIAAQEAGADCHSYTEVTGLTRGKKGFVKNLSVRDRLTGEERTIATQSVILAAGPWADGLLKRLEIKIKGHKKLLRPTKGVHLVFPRDKLPLDHAVTLISPVDGRVMFAIPWRGRTVIGTTDTDFSGDVDEVHAERADVEYLCESANGYFPRANFAPNDVIATWAGLRPLIHEGDEDASDVSREHEVFVQDDGVVIIAGGKLTTYRLMAKETVKTTMRWLKEHRPKTLKGRPITKPQTKKRPLPGARDLATPNQHGVNIVAVGLAADFGLDPETAKHLAAVYGARAKMVAEIIAAEPQTGARIEDDLPYVWAEVFFAPRHDLAKTVDDVLARRIPLLLVGRNQGLEIANRVSEILAVELDWSDDMRVAYLAEYEKSVADSRRFRNE